MTDQTESASEYAEFLTDLGLKALGVLRLYPDDAMRAAFAIRALEAKVREGNDAIFTAGQMFGATTLRMSQDIESLRADRDRLAGEVESYRRAATTCELGMESVEAECARLFRELKDATERADDAEEAAKAVKALHWDEQAKVARLTFELAEARGDSARVDALQSMLRAVDFDFEQTGESVLMFTLPANVRVGMNLRATVDAARRAGEGEK